MPVKAVGFDFFGTLVDAKADVNECISSMCRNLNIHGFSFDDDDFLESYRATVRGYREIRYEDHREVNNCVWLCDTLSGMGYNVEATDPAIVSTVERYFAMWQLSMYPEVPQALETISQRYVTGLVSNFTDSGFLYRTLRKFGLEGYFNSVVVSDAVGWRKPHPMIFEHFLDSLHVEAEATVYVGDDPEADVRGAMDAGLTAVLIRRLGDEGKKPDGDTVPDYTVNSLLELEELLTSERVN
jgi:putative hydrolase of the HAD superfamily